MKHCLTLPREPGIGSIRNVTQKHTIAVHIDLNNFQDIQTQEI